MCSDEESLSTCPADCQQACALHSGLCRTPEDVASLPAGHWCMVPDSRASSVEKRPESWDDFDGASSAKYDSYQRVMGFRAITRAWGGGAFDTRRDRLLLFGGGHNDYGGNEHLEAVEFLRQTNNLIF